MNMGWQCSTCFSPPVRLIFPLPSHGKPAICVSSSPFRPNTTFTPRRPRPVQQSVYISLCSTSDDVSNNFRKEKDENCARVPQLHPQESFLQCVQCYAVYAVEAEELVGPPRIVSCSACLHEWYATESDILWGEEEAKTALRQAALRRVQAGGSSTFVPARNVVAQQKQEKEEQDRKSESFTTKRRRRRTITAGENKSKQETEEDDDNALDADDEEKDDQRPFNVFVGNLSFRATEQDLFRAFSGYGCVIKCQVPSDPTGASRGYGFVEMEDRASGLRAIKSLQGTSILGRDVSLNEAKPRKDISFNGITAGSGGRRSRSKAWKKDFRRTRNESSANSTKQQEEGATGKKYEKRTGRKERV